MDMNNYVEHSHSDYRNYEEANEDTKPNHQDVVVEGDGCVDVGWEQDTPQIIYLNQHIVKSSLMNKEKIICVTCSNEFTSVKEAKKHSLIHDDDAETSVQDDSDDTLPAKPAKEQVSRGHITCPCGVSFSDNVSFNKHKAAVHKMKPNNKVKTSTCDICYKSFSQSAHLTNHLLVHTGVRNFGCQFCNKKFKQRGHVLNHQKIHLDEKNYKCFECGKAFRQTAHLRTHLKIHSGVKDHVCILCSKVFTQSGQLQTHMRTHTNERKYECHLCAMKFKQSGHLQSHIKRHTKRMGDSEQREKDDEEEYMEEVKHEIVEEEIVDEILGD